MVHFSEYLNSQNTHFRVLGNPHVNHVQISCSLRNGVWCATFYIKINGPHLDHTLKMEDYLTILNVFLNCFDR